jgi:NAD(P)-dependent dehydrogenase (short-subunit alcohol dehydrogenase family)
MSTLAGTRVLVVGATGALGGLVSRRLAEQGAVLAVSGRSENALGALASETGAAAIPGDLRDRDAPRHIVSGAYAALGGLNALVQAAGVVAFGSVVDLTDEVLDELVEVNLLAPIRLTREALRHVDPPGAIVNVSAVVADMPTAGMAAYSAAKAGLSAFDAAVARESRRTGIRVLDIRPPHLATGLENRAIAGRPPRLPEGRDPGFVAERIVAALADPRTNRIEMEA